MAQLGTTSSLSDNEIIAQNPIGNGLDDFRRLFREKCEELGVSEVEQLVETSRIDGKLLAHGLLTALQTVPPASLLKSRTGADSLIRDLNNLGRQTFSNDFNLSPCIPLFKAVDSHASDVEIFDALFVLLARPTTPPQTGPTTPPQSILTFASTFMQTPISNSTGHLADSSELLKDIDPTLKKEAEDRLIVDLPDFFSTFFEPIPRLSEIADIVFHMCKDSEYREETGWVGWPNDCKESKVLAWLKGSIKKLLFFASERGFHPVKDRQIVATPNQPIPGSVAKRKLDIGLIYSSSDEALNWSQILVPGELKSNRAEDNHRHTWLGLMKYVREVFRAQDTRRFVMGFTICGSLMRLWRFDRLGGMASKSFDINKDGKMFVSAILGYLWMDEEGLGFDPTILKEDAKKYIKIQRNGLEERLYLDELMQRQACVFGRATTCWRGHVNGDTQLVIKDSWEYEERPEEGALLKEATEAGVQNISRYYHHETVHVGNAVDDARNNVRNGLQDASGRNPFQGHQSAISESTTSSVTSGRLEGMRGRGRGRGRGRSGSRSSIKSITRKRSSSSTHLSTPTPKRVCSDAPAVQKDIQQQYNPVHRRVIMRDVGKSIYDATSLRALLTGLLGGIKGHESLLNGGILHRDISIGNVMLNEAEDDAFLIDLDLAVKINREKASGAPSKTGTKVFMAIGILYGEHHSFMHDLESFFWVFFWICVHWNGPEWPREDKQEYSNWNHADPKNLGKMKSGTVLGKSEFVEEVESNFTYYCEPLIPCIKQLHEVVFPDGKRWSTENRRLYSQMKSVLENAREALEV
ncbi:86454505-3836-429b-94a0-5ea2f7e49227 [Sclerotinia trifoliorum]|uniref:EKC/KEOPS complex subunit BUD32 n=1 Tax=Sclerotinia trifoliorum TaxID=28548 RepID=A0A8H2W4I7_9HELO|nr:86454505-3836-429b-94a0-5ea2f7e49227 [Sclerotinia trifoliorum]